jgi:hypothetical protein
MKKITTMSQRKKIINNKTNQIGYKQTEWGMV